MIIGKKCLKRGKEEVESKRDIASRLIKCLIERVNLYFLVNYEHVVMILKSKGWGKNVTVSRKKKHVSVTCEEQTV